MATGITDTNCINQMWGAVKCSGANELDIILKDCLTYYNLRQLLFIGQYLSVRHIWCTIH